MTGFVERLVAAARGRRVPFSLCYHGLGDETPQDDPHGLMTPPERFAAQLDQLLGLGYRLVGIDELWAALRRGGRTADRLGAITFDDGLAETSMRAAQLCADRGVTATMFLAPALLGTDHPDLPPGRTILRREDVPALERAGMAIGAHTWSHVDLPTLAADAQLEELVRSREELEELLHHPVRTMAYPYGRYDATTQRLAAEAGYQLACANGGAGPWDPLALPREPVFPSATPTRVRLKAAGLYGPLNSVSKARALVHR